MDPVQPFLHRYAQSQPSLNFSNQDLPFSHQGSHQFYHNMSSHHEHRTSLPLPPVDPVVSFRNHHHSLPETHINERGLEINPSPLLGFDRNLDRPNLLPDSRVFDCRDDFRGFENPTQFRFGNFVTEGRRDWESIRVEGVGFFDENRHRNSIRSHKLRENVDDRRFCGEIYQSNDVIGRKRFRENEGSVEIDRDRGLGARSCDFSSRISWDCSDGKQKLGFWGQRDNHIESSPSSFERARDLISVPGISPSLRYDFDHLVQRTTWFGPSPLKQQGSVEEGAEDWKWTRAPPREIARVQQSAPSTSYFAQEREFTETARKDPILVSHVAQKSVLFSLEKSREDPSSRDHSGLLPLSTVGMGKKILSSTNAHGLRTPIEKLSKRSKTLTVVQPTNKPAGKRKQGQLFSSVSHSRTHLDSSESLAFSDQRLEKSSIKRGIGNSPKERPVNLAVSFKSNALVSKEIVGPLSPMLDADKTETKKKKTKNKKENKKKKKKNELGHAFEVLGLQATDIQEAPVPSSHQSMPRNPHISSYIMVSATSSLKNPQQLGVRESASVSKNQSMPRDPHISSNITDSAMSSHKDSQQLGVIESTSVSDVGVYDGDARLQPSPEGVSVRDLPVPLETSAVGSEDVFISQGEGNVENSRKFGAPCDEDFDKNEGIAILDIQSTSSVGTVDDQQDTIPVWSISCDGSLNSNWVKCDNTPLSQSPTWDKTALLSLQGRDSVLKDKSPSKAVGLMGSAANFARKGSENLPVLLERETDCMDTTEEVNSLSLDSSEPKVLEDVKPAQKVLVNHPILNKKLSFLSYVTNASGADLKGREELSSKPQKSAKAPSLFTRQAIFPSQCLNRFKTTNLGHFAKPRTWHRIDGSSPSLGEKTIPKGPPLGKHAPKKLERLQIASYIRKGNSLVRKSMPFAAAAMMASFGDDVKKNAGFTGKTESTDHVVSTNTGRVNPPFERPKTPILPETTKLPIFTTSSPHNSPYSTTTYPAETNLAVSTCPTTASTKVTVFENQGVDSLASISETQAVSRDNSSMTSELQRMVYVKPKSNQLVAAPRSKPRNSYAQITEKTLLPSDGYYKRTKNQIVRNITASISRIKQTVVIPDDGSNSEGQIVPKIAIQRQRSFSKRRLGKVLERTQGSSKFSSVWTLSWANSHHKNMPSLQRAKFLPSLFPWKRTLYRRCFMKNMVSVAERSFLSPIRKLQLSRKRDTVYTRSSNGFSLRKSGVLSIGGSSLKWSKSIEKHSKKASEEATLAVAAVERKKREQKGAVIAKAKAGKGTSRKLALGIELHPGERIFRVGSFRYKMDPSMRTLVRIPDDISSRKAGHKSGGRVRTPFVPKRLLIGNDEYIRIGNGNQLVRDPKKMARILASEKVRWSLHTARLRLARKQQYCQFFTRFGKCNKDDGKCPYIHDPEKVAVCTKFLKGSCSGVNCMLTHKVIPERMQDCSYFLQGLCANENCPYRHVNVNPNAPVCEGFLKGYCAEGDECCKKHSYVCPPFEATGSCSQGSKCKFHHPKKREKCGNHSRHKQPKKSKGRYFISSAHLAPSVASERHTGEQNDNSCLSEGRFADYISLDVDVEEARATSDPMDTDAAAICESGLSDSQIEDLDARIKPGCLMQMNST